MGVFYADLNRRYKQVVYSWKECTDLQQEMRGLNFKKFKTEAEAEEYLLAEENNTKTASHDDSDKIPTIGSDEVGKVEPFKQLIVVAVYTDPDVIRSEEHGNELKTDDSKRLSRSRINALGRQLTDIRSYDELEDRVYINEKYGLIYCIKVITNEEYNSCEDNNTNNIKLGNALLSIAHNEVIKKVYDEVKSQGKPLSRIVIDDFINSSTSKDSFRNYTFMIDPQAECVIDLDDVDPIMETGAEAKYRATVGTASNIAAYIDELWQSKVIDEFAKIGIEFKPAYFGNVTTPIFELFERIVEKCGNIDRSPIVMKHTSHYKEWTKKHGDAT